LIIINRAKSIYSSSQQTNKNNMNNPIYEPNKFYEKRKISVKGK